MHESWIIIIKFVVLLHIFGMHFSSNKMIYIETINLNAIINFIVIFYYNLLLFIITSINQTRYFKFLFLCVLNLIYLVQTDQTRQLLLSYPREFELQSRFIRRLYIDCTWRHVNLPKTSVSRVSTNGLLMS